MVKTQKTKTDFRGGVRAVWRLLKPFKREMIIITALGIVSAVANGSIPYISGRFFDGLILVSEGEADSAGLSLWATALIMWAGVQIVANVVDWNLNRRQRLVDDDVQFNIQSAGFIHLLRLPVSYHKSERITAVLDSLSQASWRISAIVRTVVEVAPQLASILIGIALAMSIHAGLAGVLAAGVAVYTVLMLFTVRPMAGIDEDARGAWNDSWGDTAAAIHQIESVKQAAAEEHEIQKVERDLLGKARRLWAVLQRKWNNINSYQRIIVFLTQLVIFALSVEYVASGTLSVGDVIALNGYSLMFFGPFVRMGYNWEIIQNGLNRAAHLERFWNEAEEPYDRPHAKTAASIAGHVVFQNVSFRYKDQDSGGLAGVSFVADAGESVAFVGESGVGKSTAVSLISAYYFPTKGHVFIDGINTREVNLTDLRKKIAVVPQEVALFNDTIGNNIRYGTFDATDEAVHKAAREAHIDEFIRGLPQQYDTVVGERGMKLSVGQKQRIAIARAILRNPAILILDEPTSALDARTEQLITESLEKLMEGRTTFIIAHRLSTVRKADKILVFEKGRIVEQGTHDELIQKRDGAYRKLYEYQIGLH